MKYYQRIKDLRTDKDLSQKEIADMLQCSQTYYSMYELGKRKLPIDKLQKLCMFYNVSADYILGLPKNLNWPR